MGGLVNAPSFDGTFTIDPKTNSGSNLIALIVAIYEIGCFFGAVTTSFVGEKLGRRLSVLIVRSLLIVLRPRSDIAGRCYHDHWCPFAKHCICSGSHVCSFRIMDAIRS